MQEMCMVLSLHMFNFVVVIAIATLSCTVAAQSRSCGDSIYFPEKYTCFDDNFLCPVIDGVPTLRCGNSCYPPSRYSCDPPSTLTGLSCSDSSVSSFHISDQPYENYFYSDCHVAAHVLVSTPREGSNLTIISPRLIVAFPAGNSGTLSFFAPTSGENGTLSVSMTNSILRPVYENATPGGSSAYPHVGVSGTILFNHSAYLRVAVLGGIRAVRDFTEGPSLLTPIFQDDLKVVQTSEGFALTRRWLDNVTDMSLEFVPSSAEANLTLGTNEQSALNETLLFAAGEYTFTAKYNYPQLRQLPPSNLFSTEPSRLGVVGSNATARAELIESLSFLSYSQKLLAGTWRFLTYFGRDSVFSMLLLDPILSPQAWEAGLSALLERLKAWDSSGEVCHEEAIGDYAVWLNMQQNLTGSNLTQPFYDYKMADTDYLLQIALAKYFVDNPSGSAPGRADEFFATKASINPNNTGTSYLDLSLMNARWVMKLAGPFAGEGNQTKENLVPLKEGQIVGNWRDSTYGLGGGIYPYDINTALVPAALRSISKLAEAGIYPSNWTEQAADMAKIWEDETLQYFAVNLTQSEAQDRLQTYIDSSSFPGPSNVDSIDESGLRFYAVALDGYGGLSQVAVMNTDDCFRHFLLNTTNDEQLTAFVNQTANNLLRTFPAGLMTDVGTVVANPAFGSNDSVEADTFAANFSTNAYHGTVVWSFNSLSMMARGLELQLSRCEDNERPEFCDDGGVFGNVKRAYNKLWDVIEANADHLAMEVWSWEYDDGFKFVPLGDLPPPPGTSPTEADVRQLWSLTFLAVGRNDKFQ